VSRPARPPAGLRRSPAEAAGATLGRAYRRAVPTLATTQVLGGVGVASGIAVGGILGRQLSGSTSLAGLTQTMSVVGAAALALPLARLATGRGRRVALSVGYATGAAGAALTLAAAVTSSFGLLLAGMLLFGGGSASGLQARYAATDAAPPATRGRALSIVVWATTVGAVTGPNLAGPGAAVAGVLHLPPLVGPFVFSIVAFVAAVAVLLALLVPDPLVSAQAATRALTGHAPGPVEHLPLRTVLAGIRGPRAVLALASVAVAHAAMVGVMVMTPVHLHDQGASLRVVGFVISGHIAGMYALSPVFGAFADRFGRLLGILLGLGILAGALALAGTSPPTAHARLGVALALLGLGWSACLVSGSTLLTESVDDVVRTGVQGVSDLTMGLVAAAAGVLAGPVLSAFGYPSLAAVAGVLLVPVVVLLIRAATVRAAELSR